ncbi:MAG: hypothetical protein HY675_19250 [Chloroflexi bacterium]|nr:hypothetical protein [Chloroflexota bacterium]
MSSPVQVDSPTDDRNPDDDPLVIPVDENGWPSGNGTSASHPSNPGFTWASPDTSNPPSSWATVPLAGSTTVGSPVVAPGGDMLRGTEGLGVTFSGGAVGHGGTVSAMYVKDSSGGEAIVVSAGGGGMATVVNGSVSGTYQWTSASSVEQLSGWSAQAGSSYGEGLGGGVEVVTQNGVVGVEVNVGVSAGFPPVEMHGFGVHSWVIRVK